MPAYKDLTEEAVHWFVEFSTGEVDNEAKSEFDAWLRKSPEHIRVYLELMPLWEDATLAVPDDRLTAEKLIALAKEADNVVNLERVASSARNIPAPVAMPRSRISTEAATDIPTDTVVPREFTGHRSAAHRLVVAASIVFVMLASGITVWTTVFRLPTYGTAIGQHRVVKLSDGSTVELNTNSRIRVKFSEDSRRVELLQGQALFRVARNPALPFIVRSGETRVRAIGTQFDVYRKTGGTVVTVVEGTVATAPTPRDAEPVILSAGEQIVITPMKPSAPKHADVANATAWTHDRLIFESTPLPEVAEEFNRYNHRRIVVDPALQDFLVNGSFRSSDPRSLLRFLQEQPGLIVDEAGSVARISRQ